MKRKRGGTEHADSTVADPKELPVVDDDGAALLARRAELLRKQRRRRGGTAAFLALVILIGLTLARAAWTNADSDNDGLSNCAETEGLRVEGTKATWNTKSGVADTDGDGVVDGEEVTSQQRERGLKNTLDRLLLCDNQIYTAISDPTVADTDADGLDDGVEFSDGSSTFAADSDEDGLIDAAERDWGSDPNSADTDGDDIRDGDDIDEDYTPLETNERLAKDAWTDELTQGALFGDAKDIDSIPQLLGSISSGASSSFPVIGWVTGTAADLRDLIANSMHGEWISAGTSVVGILPYAGDSAKATRQVTLFIAKNPDKVQAIVKTLAVWDKVPASIRVKLLQAADRAGFEKLREYELSNEDIVKFAKRGTLAAQLVVALDKSAQSIRGIPTASADDEGFVKSVADAATALREYAKEADDGAVANEAVYIGGFPEATFSGGRLIDSCTQCEPRPEPGISTLRVAKAGSQIYSDTLQSQIDKDAYLKDQSYDIEWHFFAGPTGLSIDPRVLSALEEAEIRYFVHLPN